MRTRSIMLLVLALGCGLVASIGISQMMDARGKAEEAGERQPVFVAMADINPNDELTAQNIKLEEWPVNIIPQGALTKLEEVEGKRTRLKLYAGEPILASKLVGADDMTGAAKDIPPGYRVAHVKVDPVSGSSNLILPGDRVDVIVFRQPNSDANATAAKIVLQDLKVFAVDTHTETAYNSQKAEQGSDPITAKAISLLVTPQQAVILHAASEMGGSVRLVLRNPEDDVHITAEGATLSDIFGPDEKSDREAEKSKAVKETETKGTDEITSWLTKQDEAKTKTPPANASAYPPVPPSPINRKRMVVMYGADLVQVEIPGDGELPLNQPTNSGGANSSSLPAPPMEGEGSFLPAPPSGPGESTPTEPMQPETDQEPAEKPKDAS